MGKKRRRRSRQNWWTQSTGGMSHWLLMTLVAVLAVGTVSVSVLALSRQETTAAPQPVQTEFAFPTRAPVQKVAFIGDSWAGGAGSEPSGSDNSYAGRAAKQIGWPYEVFPGGGTGYTTTASPFGERVDAAIEYSPDVVVVQGSSNDYRADQATIEAAAGDVFARLRAGLPDAKIYALGMIDSPASPDDRSDISRAAVSAAAAANGVIWIDANAEGWLDVETDFADGYHPNTGGHEKVAARLAEILKAG